MNNDYDREQWPLPPPHLSGVPVWFVKLHVRWDAWRGKFVPEIYRTPYWAGKRLAAKRGWD